MDSTLLILIAVGAAVVAGVSAAGWDRRLPRRAARALKVFGRLFGLGVMMLGAGAVIGAVTSGPTAGTSGYSDPDPLRWVVPLLLLNAGGCYLWGVEIGDPDTGAWIRRIGWVGAVLAFALTSVSDIATTVAFIAMATLVRLPSASHVVEHRTEGTSVS